MKYVQRYMKTYTYVRGKNYAFRISFVNDFTQYQSIFLCSMHISYPNAVCTLLVLLMHIQIRVHEYFEINRYCPFETALTAAQIKILNSIRIFTSFQTYSKYTHKHLNIHVFFQLAYLFNSCSFFAFRIVLLVRVNCLCCLRLYILSIDFSLGIVKLFSFRPY